MRLRNRPHSGVQPALMNLDRTLADPENFPLGRQLDDAPDEEAIRRMWTNVAQPRVIWRNRLFGFGDLALPAVGLGAVAILTTLLLSFWIFSQPNELQITQGELPPTIQTRDIGQTLHFKDKSAVILAEASKIEVLRNEDRLIEFSLSKGRARFNVEPGGPRRWLVDAGDVAVEVVGTQFEVIRHEGAVRVNVMRGRVLVRGNVPGGRVELTAGQSVESKPRVVDEPPPIAEESQKEEAEGKSEEVRTDEISVDELPSEELEPTTRKVSGVAPKERSENLGSETSVDLDDLLKSADDERREGDSASALKLYSEVARRSGPSDPRRGIAAFSYAKLSSNPAQTARILSSSLASMPSALRKPAFFRLISALHQAGRTAEAKSQAKKYLELYPEGSRASRIRKQVGLP